MMDLISRTPRMVVLILGLSAGWLLASPRALPLRASGGDRAGESIVATGPVRLDYDHANKTQASLEAVYYLDYKGGRLVGTVPAVQQKLGKTSYLGAIAERDLAADFKIDLDTGRKPHFLMTTGSLGREGAGWSPLYVVETTTGQVAVYKIQHQTRGTVAKAWFDLVEIRSLGRPADDAPRS